MQGVSLRSLVTGDVSGKWRESFSTNTGLTLVDGSPQVKGGTQQTVEIRSVLSSSGQEVEGKARWEELYDLLADSHETINLTEDPQYDQRLNRMRDLWSHWRVQVR